MHASPGPITTDLPLPQERLDAELAPVAVAEHCEVLLSVQLKGENRPSPSVSRTLAKRGRKKVPAKNN
jgi:hypothetical protein